MCSDENGLGIADDDPIGLGLVGLVGRWIKSFIDRGGDLCWVLTIAIRCVGARHFGCFVWVKQYVVHKMPRPCRMLAMADPDCPYGMSRVISQMPRPDGMSVMIVPKSPKDRIEHEFQSVGTVKILDSIPSQTWGDTRTAASLQRIMSSTVYK